ILAADDNVHIAFGAVIFAPTYVPGATEVLRDGPLTGEGVVDRRHLNVHEVLVGLVRVESLFDDRLAIVGEGDSRLVIGARIANVAGVGAELVLASVPGPIDPPAGCITPHSGVLLLLVLRPVSSVAGDAGRRPYR